MSNEKVFKRYSIEIDISGKGWIEVLATDEKDAKRKLELGLGIQRLDHWYLDEMYLDSIEDMGDTGTGDIEEYKKETNETLEE